MMNQQRQDHWHACMRNIQACIKARETFVDLGSGEVVHFKILLTLLCTSTATCFIVLVVLPPSIARYTYSFMTLP